MHRPGFVTVAICLPKEGLNGSRILKNAVGSGRRGSNPRQPAWEAGTLPLSYSRMRLCYHNCLRLSRRDLPNSQSESRGFESRLSPPFLFLGTKGQPTKVGQIPTA